jgi:hypothetical protein
LRILTLLAAAVLAAPACVDSTGSEGTPNSVRLQSDPGDPLGAGKSYVYTQSNAVVYVGVSGSPATLTVTIVGDESWTGFFTMPSGVTRLEPGTYGAGLNWHGGYGAPACSTVTGSFTIDRVSYDGTLITAVDVSFEQHCAPAAAALHGTIHWRADDSTRPPGPAYPPPYNIWRPPSGALPGNGNFLYLESDSGDVVGQGRTDLFTPANATMDLVGAGGEISMIVGDWTGVFWKMNSIPQFTRGYYGELRSPERYNPTKGALRLSGPAGSCGLLTGWFLIEGIAFINNSLVALDLRFEQRCNGAGPALHGVIHWTVP